MTLGLAATGCGGSDYEGTTRFPLSGSVEFDDVPVDKGVISFIPATGDVRVTGGVIMNGEYTIPEANGANAGTYRVEIRWRRPTGQKVLDAEDTGEMIDVMTQVIPPKFNEQSQLTAEVSDSKTRFDFDLKSN